MYDKKVVCLYRGDEGVSVIVQLVGCIASTVFADVHVSWASLM